MGKEYEVFVENLRQILLERFGLAEEQIFFREKNEGNITPRKDRLFVECGVSKAGKEVCGIHTEELFENFEQGVSMENIADTVEREINKLKNAGFFNKTKDLDNYEKIKGDLFIRLLNRKQHQRELSRAIYRVIGDMAMVLYMQVGELDGCINSMKIRKECLEEWELDENTVFEAALRNTSLLSPPRIFMWEKLFYNPDYDGESFMSPDHELVMEKNSIGICLSTARRTNGAIAIFLPGVARRLAELLEGDYFIVFTSIHEVMIHSVERVYPEDLENVLRQTLQVATPKEDYLTSKIYRYSQETGDFMMFKGSITQIRDIPQ